MKFDIVARDFSLSQKLKKLIEEKVAKLSRYLGDEFDIRIVCRKEKSMYKMEITVTSRGLNYRADVSNNENMYANVDLALPKIERQIVKFREKNRDKYRVDAFDKVEYEFEENDGQDFLDSMIVKRKKFDIGDAMSEEDAIMALELGGHDFYIYRNIETDDVSLIYRRSDGNYGNIEVNTK